METLVWGGGERWGAASAVRIGCRRASNGCSGSSCFGRSSLCLKKFCIQPGEHSCATDSRQPRQSKVWVASDYSDSKPDSFKRRGKWEYHPSEDFSKLEREKMEQVGDKKLTDAETARTISEVNWSAILFSSNEHWVYEAEVSYLVDEHGDLYIELDEESDFLGTLSSTQIYTVLIGFGNGEGLPFSDSVDSDTEIAIDHGDLRNALSNDDDDDDDDNEDDGEDTGDDEAEESEILFWDGIEEAAGLESEDSFSSIGGWGDSKTMSNVHPLDFAFKMSEAVSADYLSEIDVPARRLTITGVVRRVTGEEERYVQRVWSDRFLGDDGEDDDEIAGDNGKEDEVDTLMSLGKENYMSSTEASTVSSDDGLGDPVNWATSEGHLPVLDLTSNGGLYQKSTPGTSSTLQEGQSRDRTRKSVHRDAPSVMNSPEKFLAIFSDSTSSNDKYINFESSEQKLQAGGMISPSVDGSENVISSASGSKDVIDGEWSGPETVSEATSFYKLDIMEIQLDSSSGVRSVVEVKDFCYAEPDLLAHFVPAIIERVNAGGKKTESALKALCQRAKGLYAEEVSLVGIDCLGIDLRVRCGIELQTVRISFSRKATSEDSAEQLLDQLLHPRLGPRRPRKRGQPWKR